MADLHLNLKGEYFHAIKRGEKTHEYRLFEKWRKRLEGKSFDQIFIKWGYPKSGDKERIITRPWLGYEVITLCHPHFGDHPVKVYAIYVN